MRGISFAITNVSEETKAKLKVMREKKEVRINKMIEDYRNQNKN